MDGRDSLNQKIFSNEANGVLHQAKRGADETVDTFLKALQSVLVKELPPQIRAQKVSLVGAYLLDTNTTSASHVDLHVTAPAATCDAESLRRHGWVAARGRYLANLSEFLSSTHSMVCKVVPAEDCFNRDMLTIVGPAFPSGENCIIRIHAGLKLSPTLLDHFTSATTVARSPFYTQLVLCDALTPALYEAIHASLSSVAVSRDICVLVKVWAEKQGLTLMPDGVSDAVLHGLVHHLVKMSNITDGMTPEQGFRLVLQFLSAMPTMTDLSPRVENQLGGQQSAASRELRAVQLQNAPLLLGFQGWNVWYSCTEQAKVEMQTVAQGAVSALDASTASDAAELLFRIPSPFWLRFDQYACVPLPTHVKLSFAETAQNHDAEHSVARDFSVVVHKLLVDALGSSLTRYRCRLFATHAVFGLGFDNTKSLPREVLGPALIDKKDAEEFSKKWGARAKTYTYDSIVRRAAVFTEAKSDYEVVSLMLACLLRDLGSAVTSGIRVLGQGATSFIEVPHTSVGHYDPAAHLRHINRKAFLELTAYLRGLDEFPVKIVNVLGAHPALRNTAVSPPHPHASLLRVSDPVVAGHLQSHADNVEAMEVVVHLASTSAWPEHKEAIAHIKTALYCKIAQRLRKERRLVSIPRRDCVDVLVQGQVFRVYVFHPREVLLLESIGLEPQAAALHKQLDLLPQHAELVANYDKFHRFFSPAVRLLKRWASVHYMADYVTEEALELVMCKIFSKAPAPYSALTGLARALHLIASWPWATLPIVVPAVTGDVSDMPHKRKDGPQMWFNTPYDSQLSPFTAHTPNRPMLLRLSKLAEESLKLYFNAMSDFVSEESWEGKWSAMFNTSLKPFNMLIMLSKDVVKHAEFSTSNKKPLGDTASVEKHPKGFLFRPGCDTRREELHQMINFDPVPWYLQQLRAHFRDCALFAYDPYGGNVIGVVGLRKFSPEEAQSLADHFQGMGKGIVKRVVMATSLQESEPTADTAAATPSPRSSPKGVQAKKGKKRTASPAQTPAEAPAKAAATGAKKKTVKKVVKRRKVA